MSYRWWTDREKWQLVWLARRRYSPLVIAEVLGRTYKSVRTMTHLLRREGLYLPHAKPPPPARDFKAVVERARVEVEKAWAKAEVEAAGNGTTPYVPQGEEEPLAMEPEEVMAVISRAAELGGPVVARGLLEASRTWRRLNQKEVV